MSQFIEVIPSQEVISVGVDEPSDSIIICQGDPSDSESLQIWVQRKNVKKLIDALKSLA